MPNAKQSALTDATVVNPADEVLLLQSGANVSAPVSLLATRVGSLLGVSPPSATGPVDWKDSVLVATTANITLSGEQTLDGVLTSASRVLVWNQTLPATNGIYVSAAGAWSRSTDADTSAEVTAGLLVTVESGTLYADQTFGLTTNAPITLATTPLTFQVIGVPPGSFVGKGVNGTSYSSIITDSNKRLIFSNAAAKTFTISPQTGGGGVAHAVNTEIEAYNAGAGLLTIAPGSGVTLNSEGGVLVVHTGQVVKIKKRANPNTWDVTGTYFRHIPQNSQSAAYTTVMSDAGKHLLHPSGDANARTFTIDSNANVPYPIGTCITFVNETSEVVSIAIKSDTLTLANTTTSGTKSLAQNGVATAIKVTSTKWIISGTGLT